MLVRFLSLPTSVNFLNSRSMRIHLHDLEIDLRALEILPTVDEPLKGGDDDDDREGDDAVI